MSAAGARGWGRSAGLVECTVAQTLACKVAKVTVTEAAECSRVAVALCCCAAEGLLAPPELWLTNKPLNHSVSGCRVAKMTEMGGDRLRWNLRSRQSLILLKLWAGKDQTHK